jgi:CheY-like chemotaxis protein
MKILVIDDNPADRNIIIQHINQTGISKEIKTEECKNLTDALPKIEKNDYDTILLDLGLPESTGIETIKIVVEHLKNIRKDIPIIILTGFEDYAMGKKAFKLGIKDYLIKEELGTKELKRAIAFATYDQNLPSKKLAI